MQGIVALRRTVSHDVANRRKFQGFMFSRRPLGVFFVAHRFALFRTVKLCARWPMRWPRAGSYRLIIRGSCPLKRGDLALSVGSFRIREIL